MNSLNNNSNGKDFSMCLATLLDGEKADDLNHEFGRFVLAPASPYPDRDLVLDAAPNGSTTHGRTCDPAPT